MIIKQVRKRLAGNSMSDNLVRDGLRKWALATAFAAITVSTLLTMDFITDLSVALAVFLAIIINCLAFEKIAIATSPKRRRT